MLSYHAALDLNHGIYRVLRLLEAVPGHSMKLDTLRILDFYFLFPHTIGDVKLPKGMTAAKRSFAARASRYNKVAFPRHLFEQLGAMQRVITHSLATKGFIEAPELADQCVVRTPKPLPDEIKAAFAAEAPEDRQLVQFLAALSGEPLLGEKGLKARTGLLEFRYDAV
jgi:hypothetical protein